MGVQVPRLEAIAVGFILIALTGSLVQPGGRPIKAHGDGFEPWAQVLRAVGRTARGVNATPLAYTILSPTAISIPELLSMSRWLLTVAACGLRFPHSRKNPRRKRSNQ